MARARRCQLHVVAVAVAVVGAAGVGACSGSGSQTQVTPAPVTVAPVIEATRVVPTEPQLPVVWPLTGVAIDAVTQRPAIAVKIENTSQARPQSGLESADVVWETIVEFDVSRFVAVYHSNLPDEIGPIRSVRPMDTLIAAPLKGLIVYSGGQQGILDLVAASSLQAISHDAGAPGLYRIKSRSAPHNVYGTLTTFLEQADANHQAPPAQQFVFATRPNLASAPLTGTPGATLSFNLSTESHPTWAWDGATGTYLRSEGSTASNAASGARLSAVNVVAITAAHPPTQFGAQNGASVPTYELVGEGDAVVSSGGAAVAGRWRKASQDDPMLLFGADGLPLLLAPGNTWVELIPAGSGSLTVS